MVTVWGQESWEPGTQKNKEGFGRFKNEKKKMWGGLVKSFQFKKNREDKNQ